MTKRDEDQLYVLLVDVMLRAKRNGASPEDIARAIARAAQESNVRRYEINDAYDHLHL